MITTIFGLGFCASTSIAQAEPPPSYAVVSSDTEFQTAIDGSALPPDTLIPLYRMGFRPDHLLLEWIGETDDWVRLATTTQKIDGLESLVWLQAYRLEFYIQKEALVPVLAKLHTYTAEDGLQTLILPGRPLLQVEADRFEFASTELSSFDPVSAEQVSDRFQFSTLEDWIAVEEGWYCSLDNGLLPAKQGCWTHEKGYSYSQAKRAYRLRSDLGGLVALTQRRDGRFDELRIAPESAHRDEPPQTLASENNSGILSALLGEQSIPDKEKVQLSEGASIFWSDGTRAGTVRQTHTLYTDQLMVHESGLHCRALPPTISGQLSIPVDGIRPDGPSDPSVLLVLCYQGADLKPVRP